MAAVELSCLSCHANLSDFACLLRSLEINVICWDVMLQLQKNDLLSVDDEGLLPPPQMTIFITSPDVLQLTITKTYLEVFSNFAQVSLSLSSILILIEMIHNLLKYCSPTTFMVWYMFFCVKMITFEPSDL